VESVAWVAERKDVLSGLLFMLTLAAYVRYAQHPFSLLRYLLVTVLFALGLMAKPMLVTLPLVLLLLDYWPLGRVAGAWNREQGAESKEPNQSLPASFPRLVVEKLPWLALAAASCLVTYWAHTTAVVDVERLTLATRFANATVSCIAYVAGFLCPVNLAVFYPHPQHTLPIWEIAGAGLLLAGISLAVVASRRKFPYLTVGWLWFLGMLVPVIGLVQVGSQAMADRYTYLTQIGLCIAVVWAVRLLLGEGPLGIDQRITSGFVAFRSAKAATFAERKATFIDRPILGRWLCGAGGALLVAGLMACAWRQTTYWQNSETLWTHTLACTSQNSTALKSLGKFLACRGRLDEAVTRFRQALEIQPHSAEAHSDLGYALAGLGRLDEAIVEFQRALEIDADLAEAENNLGIALAGQGRLEKAVAHYRRAVEIKPDYAQGHFNLGNALAGLGRLDEAIPQFQRALEIKGDLAEARGSLGFALASCGRVDEAIDQFRQALEIRPDYADAHRGLGVALAGCGEFDEALTHFQKTLEIKPDDVVALNNVAWIRATHPDAKFRDGPGAVALAQRAVALSAGDADTLNTLAAAYAEAGRFPDAVRTAKEALRAATAQGNQGLADSLRKRIEIYGQRRPWRDSPPPGPIKGR
jgi:tetratricopeptide (TPR) repeat protein